MDMSGQGWPGSARLSARRRMRASRRRSRAEDESLQREILARVGPPARRQPAHAARKRSERLVAVFVAVLGVNGLAGAEIDGVACYFHLLPLEACEVHFDATTFAVVKGVMLESVETESAAELAVDPD